MVPTTYHVVPNGDGWAVKRQGAEHASRLTTSRRDAVAQAETFARNQAPARVVVHNAEGQIEAQTNFEPGDGQSSGSLIGHPAFLLGVGLAVGVAGFTWFAMASDWGRSRDRMWR